MNGSDSNGGSLYSVYQLLSLSSSIAQTNESKSNIYYYQVQVNVKNIFENSGSKLQGWINIEGKD